MDAIKALQEHIDPIKLLEHYDFDKVRIEGVMARSCCKIHGGNNQNAFVINLESGLFYCHTGNCGGGDVYTLVQRMENCNFKEAVIWVASFFGVDIENMQIIERTETHIKDLKKWAEVMRARRKEVPPEFYLDAPILALTKLRDFQQETLEHFGVGFVESVELEKSNGKLYKLENRIVIPIRIDGKQVGVSLRKTRQNDYPKWSHQPRSIKTSQMLFNYDATYGASYVAVCEGMFDVFAYHEIGVPAVATFGAHITDEQYKMLIRTGADLIFSYDGDEAGVQATEKAKEIFKYKANMGCVVFHEEEDPASISREELKRRWEERIRI